MCGRALEERLDLMPSNETALLCVKFEPNIVEALLAQLGGEFELITEGLLERDEVAAEVGLVYLHVCPVVDGSAVQ